MASLWIAWALFAAEPEPAAANAQSAVGVQAEPTAVQADSSAAPAEETLTPPQLRAVVRAALKRTAPLLKSAPEQAAVELLPLYTQVREHPEMVKEDRDRYGGVLRSRLRNIGRTIEKRLAESAGDAEAAASADDPSAAGRESASLAEQAGAPGGRAVRDNGQELVELIQSTIAPEHWDVNGGPGSIFYYAPLRVLVVRASGTAQEAVGGVVNGLRGM